jgi:hypothetical protein
MHFMDLIDETIMEKQIYWIQMSYIERAWQLI